MTTALMDKYKTLKAKRSQQKLDAGTGHIKSKSDSHLSVKQKKPKTNKKASQPPPPPAREEPSNLNLGETFSYTMFLAEWFSMLNDAVESASPSTNNTTSSSASSSPSSSSASSSSPLRIFKLLGADHSLHVDTVRKKKVVKALQKAPPSQVNEVIAILKAMPDPTIAEFKKEHSRQASRQDGVSSPASQPPPQDNSSQKKEALDDWKKVDKGSNKKSNDQDTGLVDPESIHPPSSWWAVSFSSLLSSISVTNQDLSEVDKVENTVAAATKAEKSSWFSASKSSESKDSQSASAVSAATVPVAIATKKSSTERLAEAAAAILVANTPKQESTMVTKKPSKSSLTGKKSSSAVGTAKKATDTKATLVSTINSINKQLVAQLTAPPTHVISAYTYWWGYEIYVPHKCMSKLQRAANTSQIFFGFLSGTIAGVPGLAALVPLTKIIAAWVGFQWAVINAEDVGKGVVLSATWILPVALAPRSWDHPATEDDSSSAKKVVTKALKKITAG